MRTQITRHAERFAATLSPLNLLNALAATAPVSVQRGIAYGDGPRHRLDVYAPSGRDRCPVAVFFYGGAWEEGDRAMYRFVGSALAQAGIVTVIPDYRLFPEARFPAFVEDGAAAIDWVLQTIGRHGGDPRRTIVMGHSAGAHIAAMLALDPQWLAARGLPAGAIRGLVGLAGPYDFTPDTPNRRQIFGSGAALRQTQPIGFASGEAPPSLLATGRNDRVVDPGNSSRLADRLRTAGASVRLVMYPRPTHETLIGAFSPALRFIAPVFRDSLAFIRDVTAGSPSSRSIS